MNVMYNQDEWRVNHSSFPKNMAPIADVTSSRPFSMYLITIFAPEALLVVEMAAVVTATLKALCILTGDGCQ